MPSSLPRFGECGDPNEVISRVSERFLLLSEQSEEVMSDAMGGDSTAAPSPADRNDRVRV